MKWWVPTTITWRVSCLSFSPSPDRTSPFCSIPKRTRSSMVLISLTIVKANLILYLPFSWFISVDFCGYRLGGLNLYWSQEVAVGPQGYLSSDDPFDPLVRVVSMPCTTLYDSQSAEYKRSLFAENVPVISVEAAATFGMSSMAGLDRNRMEEVCSCQYWCRFLWHFMCCFKDLSVLQDHAFWYFGDSEESGGVL